MSKENVSCKRKKKQTNLKEYRKLTKNEGFHVKERQNKTK